MWAAVGVLLLQRRWSSACHRRAALNASTVWLSDACRLKGSYFLQQVADRKENLTRDYEAITRAVPSITEFASYHDFAWSRMMVASRNFGINIDGRKTDALVPFAGACPMDPRCRMLRYVACCTPVLLVAVTSFRPCCSCRHAQPPAAAADAVGVRQPQAGVHDDEPCEAARWAAGG